MIVWLSVIPVFVVPGAAVAPVPGLLSSAAVLEPTKPHSARSQVGHEVVGDVVMDAGQVPGVARGGAGPTGAQGISPALDGLEVAVVESGVLKVGPVTLSENLNIKSIILLILIVARRYIKYYLNNLSCCTPPECWTEFHFWRWNYSRLSR